jgi:hypothetical protein
VRINSYITDYKLYAEDINLDLIFFAKNTNVIDLWCYDEDDTVVDITGATVFFTVKEKPTDLDTAAVLKKDVTTLTNPTSGNTLITTTPTDSASLLGNYLYSIKIKMFTGEIYNLKEGNICFKKAITERTS